MSVITIPRSIRERLGDAASEDFAVLINDIDLGARKDAIAIAEERFERRMSEESGKLRLEISKVNERITDETGKLRVEIEKVRSEVEKSGKENIKWMFLFWIGQIAAFIAIIKFMVVK
ncbi:MAG: hypothetical protein HQK99_02410 [Nitrospirae bacterium]|nr:hypothetical protein [Nitrospirota bacterium]